MSSRYVWNKHDKTTTHTLNVKNRYSYASTGGKYIDPLTTGSDRSLFRGKGYSISPDGKFSLTGFLDSQRIASDGGYHSVDMEPGCFYTLGDQTKAADLFSVDIRDNMYRFRAVWEGKKYTFSTFLPDRCPGTITQYGVTQQPAQGSLLGKVSGPSQSTFLQVFFLYFSPLQHPLW